MFSWSRTGNQPAQSELHDRPRSRLEFLGDLPRVVPPVTTYVFSDEQIAVLLANDSVRRFACVCSPRTVATAEYRYTVMRGAFDGYR